MPPDVTTLDLAAFVWFAGLWLLYTLWQDVLVRRPVIVNRHLEGLRTAWVERMLEREVRIMDTQLIGHTMNSCTFFASTTMLVLAGLLGALGAAEQAHGVVSELTVTVVTSREFFEMKLLLLTVIFIFAFFQFTWAIRQFNYTCALIGAAPLAPVPEEQRRALAASIAEVMTLAARSFNSGLRSYYFALAAMAWILHPWALIVATTAVVAVIARRQALSPTEKAIRAVAAAHRNDAGSKGTPAKD